jgi:hypothetical protein
MKKWNNNNKYYNYMDIIYYNYYLNMNKERKNKSKLK